MNESISIDRCHRIGVRHSGKHRSIVAKFANYKEREKQSKKPKDFWKLIDNLHKQTVNKDIGLNTLYEYFKEINNTDHNESCDFINTSNDLLDIPITENEMSSTVKSLNKRPNGPVSLTWLYSNFEVD
ncbi:hypothetical protein CI610_03587 [invertebrate metagenome]|uniref:Uncharacterized protein n=1 Tax=invertebrate metagenome TaxID=1711999 RepID=A0A2H9T2R8_9ZZZZ